MGEPVRSRKFIAEFIATTWANPFNNRERVLFQAAAIALMIYGDDHIEIRCIRSLHRNQGFGSMAIDWLCKLADKYGVELTGAIEPCGDIRPRLGVRQLVSWYRRHGFTVIGRTISRTSGKGERHAEDQVSRFQLSPGDVGANQNRQSNHC
jgi:GNAT superfamily N-acetyltransferase